MKTIDYLFHFTKTLNSIQKIIDEGFKPSYSAEQFATFNILVPMVSFSNVLLRDSGKDEVFHYGDYGMVMTRDWCIKNGLNPVCYTYPKGMLDQSIYTILNNTAFLHFLQNFKDVLEVNAKAKDGPISKKLDISNLPQEVAGILDYMSEKYDVQLFNNIVQHSTSTYQSNQAIIKMAKPYKVKNKEGEPFIAYNDREWRKIYAEPNYIYEEEKEKYEFWYDQPKPHFHEAEYILSFELDDLKAVLVAKRSEKSEPETALKSKFGATEVDTQVGNKLLTIGTYNGLLQADL